MVTDRLVVRWSLLVVICFFASRPLAAQTWSPQSIPGLYDLSAVSFVDDQTGWISGASGVVFKTTNAGGEWLLKATGTSLHFSDHFFLDGTTGWVVGQNGIIKKTTDGGASWITQNSGTSAWLNCVYFCTPQMGWAGGANGTILKTTNGGSTWLAQQSGTTSTIEGGCFLNSSSVFMVTANGKILSSTNGGTSWGFYQTNPSRSLHAVTMCSSSNGYAVGESGLILKTTNGGGSWFSQTSGVSCNLNSVAFVDPLYGWVAGDGGIILTTTNGGGTWTRQTSTSTNNLRSLFFLNVDRGWAVGLNTTILRYESIDPVPVQLASFTATVVNSNTVRLRWRTISEVNNFGFEVERAAGSPTSFALLDGSFVAGHGTTNEPHDYTFTDTDAPAGRVYYRLKQTDLDGRVHRTEPLVVDVLTNVGENVAPAEFALKQNYPNPFNPTTNIEFSIKDAGFVSLRVYDLLGKQVATLVNEKLNPGTYTRTFAGAGLASGVYWYRLTGGGFTQTRKLIISK